MSDGSTVPKNQELKDIRKREREARKEAFRKKDTSPLLPLDLYTTAPNQTPKSKESFGRNPGNSIFQIFKSNPLVPAGMVITVFALVNGLRHMMSRKPGAVLKQQKMMRLRVGAQGFTVLAMSVGVALMATSVTGSKPEVATDGSSDS